MPSCVMRFCTNYSKSSKAKGITYHLFPSNELRKLKWTNIIRKQRKEDDWQPNKFSSVCSIHFKDDDKYMSSKGRTLLKKSAIPVLEEPYSKPNPACSRRLSELFADMSDNDDDEMSHSNQECQPALPCSSTLSEAQCSDLNSTNVVEMHHASQPAPLSPNSLDEEHISDTDSISESPRDAAYKKCMKKILIQKKILINKNRNLTKRNKRLVKKVATMRLIIKDLKKKTYNS